MQIKRITLADYRQVTTLFDNYRTFYKQPSNIGLAESFIKERLENNESVILVAFADDNGQAVPAAFTQLYPLISSVRAQKNWLLNDLYVDATYRKQGIGEALLKAAADFARSQNAKFVKLETAIDNYAAQRLYESTGFKKLEADNTFFTYRIDI